MLTTQGELNADYSAARPVHHDSTGRILVLLLASRSRAAGKDLGPTDDPAAPVSP